MIDFEMEIFTGGTQTCSEGKNWTFTEAELDAIVGSYDPAVHEAPLVIGHPRAKAPAYGWVKGLKRVGRKLVAKAQAVPEFMELVKKGLYKKRSASFTPNFQGSGTYYLNHVGFLGAMPPAVKGLADIEFAEHQELLTFACKEDNTMSFKEKFKQAVSLFSSAVEEMPDGPGGIEVNVNTPDLAGQTSTKNFSEADVQAREKAAAEKATAKARLEYEENLKKERAKTAEFQQAVRKKEIVTFCEGLKKEGKLLPAWEKLGLASFMQSLDAEETVEFAEGQDKKAGLRSCSSFSRSCPKRSILRSLPAGKKPVTLIPRRKSGSICWQSLWSKTRTLPTRMLS